MKIVVMPSGVKLEIGLAPFAEAKALYQALLREGRSIQIFKEIDRLGLTKEIFCAAFSSPDVETALEPCLKRCLYAGKKIDADTFEDVKAREDYLQVLMEVAQETVGPFAKNLFALWSEQVSKMKVDANRASSSPNATTTTPS